MKILLFFSLLNLILLYSIAPFSKDNAVIISGPTLYTLKPNEDRMESISSKEYSSEYSLIVEDGRYLHSKTGYLKATQGSKDLLNLKLPSEKERLFEIPFVANSDQIKITTRSANKGFISTSIVPKKLPSVTKAIGANGGTIEIENLVKVIFPKNSFNKETVVEVLLERTQETNLDYYSTMVMYSNLGPRLPYEIRILTNQNEVMQPIKIISAVNKSFAESVKSISAFGLIYQASEHDVLDSFESLKSKFDSLKNTLEIDCPATTFTLNRRKDRKNEAVIVIASELKN